MTTKKTKKTKEQIREQAIFDLASRNPMLRDGELELDLGAKVSEVEDNGAYVQTWMWVPFEGTELDKDK